MQMPIEPISSKPSRLGECPLWCEITNTLWWVDVLEPTLWQYDFETGLCMRHDIKAKRIGSVALRQQGGLVVACEDGLYAYDPVTREKSFIVDPEPGVVGHRKNDGRADWAGNFWVSTLREDDYAPVGSIYKIGRKTDVTTVASDMAIPNALAFDRQRKRAYFADTRAYTIWVSDWDPDVNVIGERRVFAQTTPPARPDGSCIDQDGFVWNALYSGGRLIRYTPDGDVAQVIKLPVSHPTCCSFGGPDLDQLYITSALEPLTDDQRRAEPLAGHTLVMKVGMRGRPEFRTHL